MAAVVQQNGRIVLSLSEHIFLAFDYDPLLLGEASDAGLVVESLLGPLEGLARIAGEMRVTEIRESALAQVVVSRGKEPVVGDGSKAYA